MGDRERDDSNPVVITWQVILQGMILGIVVAMLYISLGALSYWLGVGLTGAPLVGILMALCIGPTIGSVLVIFWWIRYRPFRPK